ncbi:MAG: hypothetical protein AAF409_14490 [Pseudomonadota bacterium]
MTDPIALTDEAVDDVQGGLDVTAQLDPPSPPVATGEGDDGPVFDVKRFPVAREKNPEQRGPTACIHERYGP